MLRFISQENAQAIRVQSSTKYSPSEIAATLVLSGQHLIPGELFVLSILQISCSIFSRDLTFTGAAIARGSMRFKLQRA